MNNPYEIIKPVDTVTYQETRFPQITDLIPANVVLAIELIELLIARKDKPLYVEDLEILRRIQKDLPEIFLQNQDYINQYLNSLTQNNSRRNLGVEEEIAQISPTQDLEILLIQEQKNNQNLINNIISFFEEKKINTDALSNLENNLTYEDLIYIWDSLSKDSNIYAELYFYLTDTELTEDDIILENLNNANQEIVNHLYWIHDNYIISKINEITDRLLSETSKIEFTKYSKILDLEPIENDVAKYCRALISTLLHQYKINDERLTSLIEIPVYIVDDSPILYIYSTILELTEQYWRKLEDSQNANSKYINGQTISNIHKGEDSLWFQMGIVGQNNRGFIIIKRQGFLKEIFNNNKDYIRILLHELIHILAGIRKRQHNGREELVANGFIDYSNENFGTIVNESFVDLMVLYLVKVYEGENGKISQSLLQNPYTNFLHLLLKKMSSTVSYDDLLKGLFIGFIDGDPQILKRYLDCFQYKGNTDLYALLMTPEKNFKNLLKLANILDIKDFRM